MKRTILTVLAVLVFAVTGALFAQSFNGTAPQGTQNTDPGQTSNNLNTPRNTNPSPATDNGMTTGTNSAPATRGTTGTTDTTATQTPTAQPATGSTTGTTATTGATTGYAAPTGTGTGSSYTSGTSTSDDSMSTSGTGQSGRRLPRTASELPLIAALGFLALGAGFIVRSSSKV